MKRFTSVGARAAAATTLASALLCFSQRECASDVWLPRKHGMHRYGTAVAAARMPTTTTITARRCQSSSSSTTTAGNQGGEGNGSGGPRDGTSTGSGHGTSSESGPTEAEQAVLNNARPLSSVMEERLGFAAGETIDEESLKTHFFVLAKHYHPDSASAPPNAAEVFVNIKDAYEALLTEVKGGRSYTSHSDDGYHGGFGGGPSYADEAKRRARMRALGDGVMFFVLATIAYIIVIATHNRERLKSRYLLHLFGIFFIIQLFPRLLAATLLFAVHTGYLIKNGELAEQAATVLLIDQRGKDLHVRVEGLNLGCTEHTVVQVEIAVEPQETDDGRHVCKEATQPPAASVVSSATTTLTLDRGVTKFTLPLPPKGEKQATTYKVKAVDEHRMFVVLEKKFKLA